MIDTDKYKIEDDVVWIWNDFTDEEGWVLWEYKECPAEKGGYTLMDGRGSDKTYEPSFQVLPALKFECDIDERMQAIMDLPNIIQEVKRLREGRLDLINEVIRIINNKTGERVDADLHDYIIDRLVNE